MRRLARPVGVAALAAALAACSAVDAASVRPQPRAFPLPQLTPLPTVEGPGQPLPPAPIIAPKPKPKPPPPPPPERPVLIARARLDPIRLSRGMHGTSVLKLEKRLVRLGYWLGDGPDETYGYLTQQAVTAYQKVRGLRRDGVAGERTRREMERAQRRPRSREGGDLIEIDLDRQVLYVVRAGRVRWILNASTGNGSLYRNSAGSLQRAYTPTGRFRTIWQVNGWRRSKLGMLYRPKYFTTSGIAVHGSYSVPAYPASHGCVRVSISAADWLWSSGYAPLGTTVWVYRGAKHA